jgi:hypothetical protein
MPPGTLASAHGGVVFVDSDATATLNACAISDATATSTQQESPADARGGVVFVSGNASATLSACSVARASAVATSGVAHGGVMSIGFGAQGKLLNCTIVGAGATSTSGNAQGSVVGLGRDVSITAETGSPYQSSHATIEGCDISHAVVTSMSGDAEGGVVHASALANITMNRSIITSAATTSVAGSARGGLMRLLEGANAALTGCHVTNVTSSAANAALGGCLMLSGNGVVARLVDTQLHRCAAYSQARHLGEGGAAYASSGAQLIMSSGTLLIDNVASASGSTVKIVAASATYVLPAPTGRWVSGVDCYVRRAACDPNGVGRERCEETARACGLLTDHSPFYEGMYCTGRLSEQFQRCNYNDPQLLGQRVETLPEGAVDNDYPNQCKADPAQ